MEGEAAAMIICMLGLTWSQSEVAERRMNTEHRTPNRCVRHTQHTYLWLTLQVEDK